MSDTPSAAPGFLTIKDYLARPVTHAPWLIDRLVPAGGSVTIYGPPKTGKSHAVLQMAMALTGTFDHWLGFDVIACGNVVYLGLDQSPAIWRLTFEKVAKAGYNLDGIHFADRETFGIFPFNVGEPAHAARLKAAIQAIQPVAVIVDTMRKTHSLREDSSDDMNLVINALLAAVAPATIIMIAHSRKSSPDREKDVIEDQRGSSGVGGDVDTVIRVDKTSMTILGRVIPEMTLKLVKSKTTHFWALDDTEFARQVIAVLKSKTVTALSERTDALMELSGRSRGYCYSVLRKALEPERG